MKAGFFPKLALSGIRKNAKTYVPYLLTCIGCVAMFYIIYSMSQEEKLDTIFGGMTTKSMLLLGSIVVGIFSLILLFYTNSFLIKRRKKELGLYNVLGMGKIHIMRVIFFETLFIALFSIAVGLCAGMLLSKLLLSVLLKILDVTAVFTFDVSVTGVIATAVLFGVIFFLNLALNIFRVGVNNPVEMLRGGQVGEKEPRTNIPLALVGFVTLGLGYYIAVTVNDPVTAVLQFFLAVLLVIVGTFSLVTAGSTVILKALKRNKGFYYKPNHFISVSGMLYRMKQNAAGIASICILSTMVLVTVSTTFCLYFGIGDSVKESFQHDVLLSSYAVLEEDPELLRGVMQEAQEETGGSISGYMDMVYYSRYAQIEGETAFSGEAAGPGGQYLYLTGLDKISLPQDLQLKEGQVALFSKYGYTGEDITIDGTTYEVVIPEGVSDLATVLNTGSSGNDFVVVFPQYADIPLLDQDKEWHRDNFLAGFDTPDEEIADRISASINNKIEDTEDLTGTATSKREFEGELRSMYGSFLFLGVFLGLLFLMATVLIMYYKQISEGYDDKYRFEILEKVGMSQGEIKKTIHSQVLMVFFIPLLFSVVHICFAFNMISLILSMLGLSNVAAFIFYTVGSVLVFGVIYTVVYLLTARTYYRIVR